MCYIGEGRYGSNALGLPFLDQDFYSHGPSSIGEGSRLVAGTFVLERKTIEKNCIVGTGVMADYCVAAGVTAKLKKSPGKRCDIAILVLQVFLQKVNYLRM